jgi:hypothetical protein
LKKPATHFKNLAGTSVTAGPVSVKDSRTVETANTHVVGKD